MLPYLFKLGPLTVYPWGVTLSIAILLGTLVATKLARKINMNSDQILDLAIVLIIGGVVGARLFYVFVYEPARYIKEPLQIFALWNGGMVYYGALIGGFVTGTWYVREKKLPFWSLVDVVAPPLALGYGIVRIGCFLNGCCYGKPTTSSIGVIFPYLEGTPYLDQVPRYPTQLFSSLIGFILFGLLLYLWRKKRFDGQVFLVFLIMYTIGRSVVEYFRENLLVFGPVTVSQLVSILIIIPAVYFYWRRSRKTEKKPFRGDQE
ncbi:MAG: prolipoprotein diacylglyceryl transferase [Eubacteriales bacterium]